MDTINAVFESNPPPAIELVYLPGLPAGDRKPDVTSYAFPLGYFPASAPNPQEAVIAPTSPAEIFNYAGISSDTFAFASGSSIYDPTRNTDLVLPPYNTIYPAASSGEFTPVNFTKRKDDETGTITLSKPTTPIHISGVESDSALTWLLLLKNGSVYRDFKVTQEELDYTDAPPSGQDISQGYSGSWLKAAGFIAGDRIRLFYTIPGESLWFDYNEGGEKSTDGLRELTSVLNAEALHENNGDIVFDSDNIHSVQRLSEISTRGERVIFDSVGVTGTLQSADYSITQFDGAKGTMRVLPSPPDGAALRAQYIKEAFNIEYRGFYDEVSGLWQSLDLNPAKNHFYNTGADRNARTNRPSEELVYRGISIYLLPVGALRLTSDNLPSLPIQYYSAYAQGDRPGEWSPLRHYVLPLPRGSSTETSTQEEIASWGYAQYDSSKYAEQQDFSAAQKGIPMHQDSAILLARVRVRPRSRTELQDARRFSGLPGNYDRKNYTGNDTDPRTRRWDTSPWEGLAAPLSATVLVEIDADVIEREGLDVIEKAVQDNIPPGILAIVLPKES